MSFDVLLQQPDGTPFLEGGLPEESGSVAKKPGQKSEVDEPDFLGHFGDPNDIDQGWAVLYPVGRKDLLDAIGELVRWRQEKINEKWAENRQPGTAPTIPAWEIPAHWDPTTFWAQIYDKLPKLAQPRFILILGDFPDISITMQQGLTARCFVGRLCFMGPNGHELGAYAAYAQKVVASEKGPADFAQPRMLFYSTSSNDFLAKDRAVDDGHGKLIEPMWSTVKDVMQGFRVSPEDALLLGPKAPAGRNTWDNVLSTVAVAQPSILLSLSHGAGLPQWTPEEQRQMQGRMKLSAKQMLNLEDVAKRPFLPNGAWFYYACFGGGTPADSPTATWLRSLEAAGYWPRTPDVINTLSHDGRAFVALQPQYALANPQGPLAVYAHVDIAFTYGYKTYAGQDLIAGATAGSFTQSESVANSPYVAEVLGALAAGKKSGLALDFLTTLLSGIDEKLLRMYDEDAVAADMLVRKIGDMSWRSQLFANDPVALSIFKAYDTVVAQLGSAGKVTLDTIAEAANMPVNKLVAAFNKGVQDAQANLARTIARSHNWMARQDLRAFVLLGDPAASLPLSENRPRAARSTTDMAALLGFGAPSATPVTFGSSTPAAPVATPAPETATSSIKLPAETVEEAIHDLIAGELSPKAVAEKLGVDRRELERLKGVYTEAGLAAIRKALGQ